MEQTIKNPFESEPIGKLLIKFSIPCVISLVVNALYNIVDQIFIGQGVGYLGNGATNVVFPITVIALAFSLLIGDGGAAFLSLRLGENKKEEARKGIGSAILMVTIISLILTIITFIWMRNIVQVFGATDKLLPYALDYGYIIAMGLPFVMISTALNSIIRADGSPQFAMMSMLLGAIINTILDPVFIFPLQMGVQGAAIATVLGQVASFIVSALYLRKFHSFTLNIHDFKIHKNISLKVLSLGISSFITQLSITIVMAITNNLLTKYGANSIYGAEIPLTAMGIVMKVNQIMISILVGIAAGAQPIIGYNYGAANYDRVKKTFLTATITAEIITIIAFIFFEFFPMSIVSLFGSEEGLYNEFAIKCFKIFLLLCMCNGFQTVASIYLQSVGKPVQAAIVSLSRQIVFLIPSAIILPLFIGLEGVLWAGPVADGLAFILSFVLIQKDMRKLTSLHNEKLAYA